MNTTTTTFVTVPEKLRKTSACPHCGAPIYADASFTEGKDGEVLTVLPTPWYTCGCRFNLQPALQPLPISPVIPLVPGNPGDTGWPYPTWREPQTGDPMPWRGNTFCRADGSIDWSQFTGSGGVTQNPDMKVTAIL